MEKKIHLRTIINMLFRGNYKTSKIILDNMIYEMWQSEKAMQYMNKWNKNGYCVINIAKDCYNLVVLNKGISLVKEN